MTTPNWSPLGMTTPITTEDEIMARKTRKIETHAPEPETPVDPQFPCGVVIDTTTEPAALEAAPPLKEQIMREVGALIGLIPNTVGFMVVAITSDRQAYTPAHALAGAEAALMIHAERALQRLKDAIVAPVS